MCDESGANFKGIEAAFDKQTVVHKVKTCQWHFKHQAREKAKLCGEFEEEVLTICSQMCAATTVPQYEQMLNRLLEIADMHPAFLPFVKWWDARRYHVFKVFRDFNLPGVNCAEMGNAAWKREGKISLVEAANDDISTMVVQEREYLNFKSNDFPSPLAAGPTDKKRASKSYKVQMAAAKDIADMLSLPSQVDSTINEIRNPKHFMPKPHEGHKCKSKGKGRGKAHKKFITKSVGLEARLAEAQNIVSKCQSGSCEVQNLGSSETPRKCRPLIGSPFNPNFPHVTFLSGLGIRKCQGCPAPIEHLPPPLDMVFRFRCIRPFLNKRTNLWQDSISNGYCHLDMTCLLSHNNTFRLENIRMEDKTFLECTPGHLEFLNQFGILETIGDKMKVQKKQ